MDGEAVKPCDMPCEKCGHTDIHRVFRAKGDRWRVDEYGMARNRYASAQTYIATAHRDHLTNHCRCCGYDWQTLPLRKPKRRKIAGSTAECSTKDSLSNEAER